MGTETDAIVEVFLGQTEEALDVMERELLALEAEPHRGEALAEVFRLAHTLKGDAGSLGFGALTALAHHVEDLLEAVRGGRVAVTPDRVGTLLRAVDVLRTLLRGAARGHDAFDRRQAALEGELAAAATGDGPRQAGLKIRSEARASPWSSPSLRVDRGRLDHLLNLTGEIAVTHSRLSLLLRQPETPREMLQEAHLEAARLHTELHELVMQIRLVPVGPTFERLARVVRDTARAVGKEARLEVHGGEVEVDSSVLELLRDPLSHMVRNAVDHGIEPPPERVANGKARAGLVVIRAARTTSGIVVELEDDGAGLSREGILEIARARGLVAQDSVPDDARLHELIFEPGFSTAGRVTEISGRGVGLDVVRRNIHALRGSIGVSSRSGHGTTIAVRIPLTLAVIEGLVVGLEDEAYVLPLENVRETLQFPAEAASSGEASGVVLVRSEVLPFVRLRHAFGLAHGGRGREVLVVAQDERGRAGLVVDAVYGQGQFVIKPLPRLFGQSMTAATSTILGDGRVALIADVATLLRSARERPSEGDVASMPEEAQGA